MTNMQHVVRFRSGLIQGDDYEGCTHMIRPADQVLAFVEKPRDDPDGWNAGFQTSQWEKACKMLKELGNAMVRVQSFGVVVGDFLIRPYFVSPEQYHLYISGMRHDYKRISGTERSHRGNLGGHSL